MDIVRIAMIYREVGTCGGIQRGASFQVCQFKEWGYEPIVLTERDLGRNKERVERLSAILRKRNVDVIIEHDAYSGDKLSADMSAAEDCGVPLVVFWHSVFSWMIANGSPQVRTIYGLLRRANALITLSSVDEAFFRMMGCRALAIPYCDADLMSGFVRRNHPHNILWMGRLVDFKRPLDAVKIVERLRMDIPDAELTLLGDGPMEVRATIEKYIENSPLLRNAVRLEGFQKNVRPYLERAGAGLVTSKFEGFCHAIVEMKMAEIPIVAYSMPYLDNLADGTGTIQIPQGDVAAAAGAIKKLFSNPEECAEMGRMARRSYERLRAFDQRSAYQKLFSDIVGSRTESALTTVDSTRIQNIIEILVEHCVVGFNAVKVRERRKASDENCGKGLLARLGRLFVWFGRFLCRCHL